MSTDLSLNTDGSVTVYQGGRKVARGTVAQIIAMLGGDTSTFALSVPVPRPKKVRPKSRADRWAEAAEAAMTALEELRSIQEDELEPWKDNLHENLQNSTLADKLETICGIDIQAALDVVEEARDADMPLGFGRD